MDHEFLTLISLSAQWLSYANILHIQCTVYVTHSRIDRRIADCQSNSVYRDEVLRFLYQYSHNSCHLCCW